MLYTLSHELTHYIKEWSPAKFQSLANFLMEQYGKQGQSVDELVQAQIRKAKSNGRTIDYATAYEEVIADSMESMLTDGKVIEKLQQLYKQEKTLFEKISDFINKWIDKVKQIYSRYSPNSKEGKLVLEMKDSLEELQSKFAEAIYAASENATEIKNTAEAVDKVLFSIRDFTLTESDIQKNMLFVGKMDNVADLSGNEFAKGKVGLPDQVDAFFAKYNYTIENPDIGDVEMNRRGAKDSIAHGIGRVKSASFAAVPHTIEKGKIIDYQKKWKGRQYDTVVLAAPISINGEKYYQGVIVIREASTQRFYLHEVLTEKESDTSFKTGAGAKHTPGDVSPSLLSLLKKVRDVNSQNDVAYSDHTESQQFKNWFGDWQSSPESASKVVNADGTPKVMYHGTPAQFTAFDKKKAKSSGFYGRGFYFTDSESHSNQYGNSMAVYLNVKNPLAPGENALSKTQLKKFLEAVAENEDDYDIWNYGTENIDEIVNRIYKNDAFAVIQDVNATAIGDFAEALRLFNEVNGTDFDGIITPTETVVYEPTQIKSATGNIGTFDGSNPDIRYSDRDYSFDPELVADLQADADKLKSDVANLKEFLKLQKTVTHGTVFTKTSVNAAASKLMKTFGMNQGKVELATALNEFYRFL